MKTSNLRGLYSCQFQIVKNFQMIYLTILLKPLNANCKEVEFISLSSSNTEYNLNSSNDGLVSSWKRSNFK